MATRMYVCESSDHPSLLLSSLNEQRLKGQLCDVTVRVQGHFFKAHTNVLASAMGYFRDLFSKATLDQSNDFIDIPVIVNTTGFAKILDFVYTSQLCLSQSTVMQVLCSACYLQIPYVVEKCQEFITSHGHVTHPSDLSDVAKPRMLKDSQQQKFYKQSAQVLNSSASANLSFLSKLNRLSEKSRARLPMYQPKAEPKSRSSNDAEDQQQECELITTPPSPSSSPLDPSADAPSGGRSFHGDQLRIGDVLSLKRERDVDSMQTDDKQADAVDSSTERKFTTSDDFKVKRTFIYTTSDNQQTDFNSQAEIDHKSLADYFSTDKEQNSAGNSTNNENSSALLPYQFPVSNGYDEPMMNEEGNMVLAPTNGDGVFEAYPSSSFMLHPKKDKPRKDYKCEHCGKMFGRQQHLKRHILTHTGERPYPCQHCDKKFRRSEHLKSHLMSHGQRIGDENPTQRKRARRAAPTEDAYVLSRMMLDRYNGQKEIDENGNMAENGVIASAPAVLPSMLIDREEKQSSPQAVITELDDTVAPNNDNNEAQTNDISDHRMSSSSMEESNDAALNLSHVQHKPQRLKLTGSDDTDRTLEKDKGNFVDRDLAKSESSSPTNNRNDFDENQTDPDLAGVEGSEVLSTDLKQLMAAIDE